MKFYCLNLIFAFLLSGGFFSLKAQISELEVGPSGSNQVSAGGSGYSGAIGRGNSVEYNNDLAVGDSNTITSYNSVAIGAFNVISYGSEYGGGTNSLVVGTGNGLGVFSEICFVAGSDNHINGTIGSDDTVYSVINGAALGRGLRNSWSNSTIVGQYNDGSFDYFTPLLFAIGNGTDNTHRSNALTVFQNGNMVVTGTDSRLPNQTLADAKSIVTRELGDGRYLTPGTAASTYLTPSAANSTYLRNDSVHVAVGNTVTATGTHSIAMGWLSDATGNGSVALGEGNIANGYQSVAIGGATEADGELSVALGGGYATGDGAVATGISQAAGLLSTSMGYLTYAGGDYSTSLGLFTDAEGYAQVVMGRYNVTQGSTTSWNSTDDLFIIGNGTSYSTRSNAFVVKKNGDTSVNGKLAATGDTTLSGKLTVSNKARFDQAVRVAPQGDISMGEFTAEP
jgi:hypothetical protein